MAVNTFCVVLVVLFCHLFSFSSAGFLTGGATGNDSSHFLTGTPNTPKVRIGLTCSRLNTSSDLKVAISVFENDNQFNTTGGPNGNNVVTWAKCQMIDVAMYRNATHPMKQRIHTSGCNVTRVDSDGTITADDVDERTLANSIEFDPLGSTVPCGGLQEGTKFTFLMECFRHEHVTKHFDFMAEFMCDNDTALIRQLDTDTTVGGPAVLNITRRVYVDRKLFWVMDASILTRDTRLEYVEGTNLLEEVTSGMTLPLGASLILQACIKINSSSDSRLYFRDGLEHMGLNIKQMTFSNIDSVNPVQANQLNSQQVVFDRCANQTEPMSEVVGKASVYFSPDIIGDTTKWHLVSPNCFVVGPWSVAAFVTKNVGISKMNISGEYDYCTTSALTGSVNHCFGNLATTDQTDGYTTCPASGRKRRDVSAEANIQFYNDDLPAGFDIDFFVDTDDSSEEQGIETGSENSVATEKCFEKDTFAILTAVLGFLLAAVLMTSVFLACRIHSVRREVKESSKNSFSNKGYF